MQMHTLVTLERSHGLDLTRTFVTTMIDAAHIVFGRIGAGYRHWQANAKARRDRDAFLDMPDYLLRDIGLTRHDLDFLDLHPSDRRTRT